MACKFNYKGKEYNSKAELMEVLSKDSEIVKKYFPQEGQGSR